MIVSEDIKYNTFYIMQVKQNFNCHSKCISNIHHKTNVVYRVAQKECNDFDP